MRKLSEATQSHTGAALEIRLFGTFDVLVQGAPIPPLRTSRGQWLLALLALRHDRDTLREWLAGTLWPDSDESHALANLRRSLNDLRHALGNEAERVYSPSTRTLRLDLRDAFCDTVAFDALLKTGTPESLEKAVALYRGPLLESGNEPYLLPERASREDRFLEALQTLAHYWREQGDRSQAVAYYQRILATNPLREVTVTGLMEALHEKGEFVEAIRAYRAFRLLLRQELNTEPGGRVTALYRRIQSEAGLARSQAKPFGKATGSASPHLSTPLPTVSRQSNMPHHASDLFGREQEIWDCVERLQNARLLTLTGIGGIGKTRLAHAVAQEAAEEYPGGVWFVPLAEMSEVGRIMDVAREAMHLPVIPTMNAKEQIAAHCAECPSLMVLDNFEQLLPAGAQVVQELLEIAPQLTILVTSRQLLRLSLEWDYPVPPLALPERASPPRTSEEGMKFASVALFAARAKMRNPAFQLTPSNLPAVVSLCAVLEGIPLATELAAAWTQLLTPEQIRSRLNRRFDLLTSRQQDVPSRHRSLYAALESSYRLLAPDQQRFFARLSVFRGGWSLEAAETVCGEAQALEHLAALREASLIFVVEACIEMRYGFLETVREFASEQLTPQDRQETEQRHTAYFMRLTEQVQENLWGREQVVWLDRLERDHDNVRAALDGCEGADPERALTGLRFATKLCDFWEQRGHIAEARQRLAVFLGQVHVERPSLFVAEAYQRAGDLAHRQGDFAAAEAFLERALQDYRALPAETGAAQALTSLGELKGNQGEWEVSQQLLAQALQMHQTIGDRRGEAQNLGFLGYIAREQQDLQLARRLTEQALAIHRGIGNPHGEAWALGSLGYVFWGEGDYEGARRTFEQAMLLCRSLQQRSGEGWGLISLAHIARKQGDYDAAISYLEQALWIYRERNEFSSIGWTLCEMGATLLAQGKREEARAKLEEALVLLNRYGERKISEQVLSLLKQVEQG